MAINITAQPKAFQEVRLNGTITLTVESDATTHAWYKLGDPVAISGQTTKTLTIANAKPEHFGIYYCLLTKNTDTLETIRCVVQEDVSAVEVKITTQPTDKSVDADAAINVTVAATTNDTVNTLVYDWALEGQVMMTTTTGTLAITHATSEHTGEWTCVVRAGDAYAVSNPFMVTVSDKPFIRFATQPKNVSVKGNTEATFTSVPVTNYPELVTYQWYKENAAIDTQADPSAATPVLELDIVDSTDNTKKYKCEANLPAIGTHAALTVTSSVVTLTVTADMAVSFTLQPSGSASTFAGTLVKLQSTAKADDTRYPVSFQWKKDGVDIQGATEEDYEFIADAAVAGAYKVTATAGPRKKRTSTDSSEKTFTLNTTAPTITITGQPAAIDVASGIPAVLSVTATAAPEHPAGLHYQWKKNDVAIPGATESVLAFPGNGNPDLDGSYKCTVSTGVGATAVTKDSNAAQVKFTDGKDIELVIGTQPTAQTNKKLNEIVELTVAATTKGFPLTYQWYRDNNKVMNATKDKLKVLVNDSTAGKYYVMVGSGTKTLKSTVVAVGNSVHNKVVFTKDPASFVCNVSTTTANNKVTLAADAKSLSSGHAVTYKWYKNGTVISNQTNKTHEVTGITENTAAQYQCSATVDGQEILSKVAWVIGTKTNSKIYANPLKQRNSSFMWKGYWVTDVIGKANKEGVNWLINRDPDAQYSKDIESIIQAMSLYGASEVQESRDGYILKFMDLPINTPTTP